MKRIKSHLILRLTCLCAGSALVHATVPVAATKVGPHKDYPKTVDLYVTHAPGADIWMNTYDWDGTEYDEIHSEKMISKGTATDDPIATPRTTEPALAYAKDT
jgi:hypothetical protein